MQRTLGMVGAVARKLVSNLVVPSPSESPSEIGPRMIISYQDLSLALYTLHFIDMEEVDMQLWRDVLNDYERASKQECANDAIARLRKCLQRREQQAQPFAQTSRQPITELFTSFELPASESFEPPTAQSLETLHEDLAIVINTTTSVLRIALQFESAEHILILYGLFMKVAQYGDALLSCLTHCPAWIPWQHVHNGACWEVLALDMKLLCKLKHEAESPELRTMQYDSLFRIVKKLWLLAVTPQAGMDLASVKK